MSAKTGENVEKLLQRIIEEVPPPSVGEKGEKLKLFLINSWFVNNKNVVCLFYVMSGSLKKSTTIVSCGYGKHYQVFDVGLLQPELTSFEELSPGQIGYAISNMKQVKEARIGDTFYKLKEKVEPEPGFKASKPMVYAGLYPLNPDEFHQLEKKYVGSNIVWKSSSLLTPQSPSPGSPMPPLAMASGAASSGCFTWMFSGNALTTSTTSTPS